MHRKSILQTFRTAVFVLFVLVITAGSSAAAVYWLRADTITKAMPDGQVITMWGFAQCTASFASCAPATVPGPVLVVPPRDTTLTVNLRNNLTGPFVEPVSLIIRGQSATITPVWIDAAGTVTAVGSRPPGDVTSRVRSLTHETAPGATGIYTWPNVKVGTYLYQSATHQSLQVQMGLYGAMKKNLTTGQAYTGASFSQDVLMLFSEVDPAVHAHVANGTYGTPPPAGITSTIDFHPKYFLINGQAYSSGQPFIGAARAGQNTLVRLVNAGLRDYVPLFQGSHLTLIAEDGNLLPYGKEQYSVLLPAGKTMDALLSPSPGSAGTVPVYDRRLNLTNNTQSPGGMLTYFQILAAGTGQIGIYRSGSWYVDANNNGLWDGNTVDVVYPAFGGFAQDIPVTGDWDGNGSRGIGIYRRDAATNLAMWYLDANGNGAWDGSADIVLGPFGGLAQDVPVTGDWTNTGVTRIGIYRRDAATNLAMWYLDISGDGVWTLADDGPPLGPFGGLAQDIPVTGDWTGTGVTRIGIYRRDAATNLALWYLDIDGNGVRTLAGDGPALGPFGGLAQDVPVTGDWTNTGVTRIGIYRRDAATNVALWYLDIDGNGVRTLAGDGPALGPFGGLAQDIPVTGLW